MEKDTYDLLGDAFQSFLDDHATGQGFTEQTDQLWSEYMTRKGAELVYEDHEKHMTASEMAAHLRKLFNMCEDEESEKKFLKKLGEGAGKSNCTEKDIKECAKTLCNKSKEECDKLIHKLEDHVGYEYKPEKDDKKLDEAWGAGGRGNVVVHNETGKKGVILATDGGDANVAPMVGNTPRFRSPSLWRKGTYKTTGDKVKVPDSAPGGKKEKEEEKEED